MRTKEQEQLRNDLLTQVRRKKASEGICTHHGCRTRVKLVKRFGYKPYRPKTCLEHREKPLREHGTKYAGQTLHYDWRKR